MISYKTIREGIADAILQGFKSLPIDDETAFHIEGPAFLVRLADNAHILDDRRHVRRQMDFNVVYFAPHETPVEKIMDTGLKLAALFQPTISFGGRHITVEDVSTTLVDEDFQVDFRLDFFDEIREEEPYEYMEQMEFRFVIEAKE